MLSSLRHHTDLLSTLNMFTLRVLSTDWRSQHADMLGTQKTRHTRATNAARPLAT